jgi:glycerate dehydrogenase
VSREEAFAEADVISLHCPLTDETESLINAEALQSCRPTALLLNTARGALIDEDALADALRSGQIAGAGLDVLRKEPMRAGHPFIGVPNLVLTPHVAWRTPDAIATLLDETRRNIEAFQNGEPQNVVTP